MLYLFTTMDDVQLSKHALTSLFTYLVTTVYLNEQNNLRVNKMKVVLFISFSTLASLQAGTKK